MYEGFYVKPCIRENNPEYAILHVGSNEINSELTSERIANQSSMSVKIFKPTIDLSIYPV